MPKLTDLDKKIINSALSAIDWDQIVKFYKILNKKIGTEQIKITGVVKSDRVSVESVRDEIEKVLTYIIENDIPEMSYGHWYISWVNGEWETFETIQPDPEQMPEEIGIPLIESKLQVNFIPQSVTVKDEVDIGEITLELDENSFSDAKLKKTLEDKLNTSIGKEDYSLASKIRDLLEALK